MRFLFIPMIAAVLFAAGCTYEKFGEFEVPAINTVAGVSAGMNRAGDLFVLCRDDQRQAVHIPDRRTGELRIFNCADAPLFFVKTHFFGKKTVAILKIELPAKGTDLKFYRYKEIGENVTWGGKKAWIVDLKSVSPDGKQLQIVFEVAGEQGRRTGFYYPATNQIMAR